MRPLLLSIPILLALGTAASAASNYVVNGLFCKTRADLDEAIAHIYETRDIDSALRLTNREEVVCMFDDHVRFMLENPSALGKTAREGTALYLYEAAAVGMVVGDNPRPLTPAVHMFFALSEELPGVARAGDA